MSQSDLNGLHIALLEIGGMLVLLIILLILLIIFKLNGRPVRITNAAGCGYALVYLGLACLCVVCAFPNVDGLGKIEAGIIGILIVTIFVLVGRLED